MRTSAPTAPKTRILLTGATGFIGGHILSALLDADFRVRACVRDGTRLGRRDERLEVVELNFASATQAEDWQALVQGVDLVINAVGIISESGRQTFRALHTEAPCALFQAAAQAGVRRVVQISALGAALDAQTEYHRSKARADACLMQLPLDWVVLQPSLVYGPGDGSMGLFRAMAGLPVIPLFGGGEQRLQPVQVGDLARCLLGCIEAESPMQQQLPVAGEEVLSLRQLYTVLRGSMGLDRARFIALPQGLVLAAAHVTKTLGNRLLTPDNLRMLAQGNTADLTPFRHAFGFVPTGLSQQLQREPISRAERLHARLYFLAPLLRFSLAFLWLFTAWVSLFAWPMGDSRELLVRTGIPADLAPATLYLAAMLDAALGMAVLLAWRPRLIGLLQLGLILGYSLIIALMLPEFWLHPFGPLTKNIPILVAILIWMQLEHD